MLLRRRKGGEVGMVQPVEWSKEDYYYNVPKVLSVHFAAWRTSETGQGWLVGVEKERGGYFKLLLLLLLLLLLMMTTMIHGMVDYASLVPEIILL
jgi:hypothetical protein